MSQQTFASRTQAPDHRGRIGARLAGGFYPEPHRYELYVSEGCPQSLRVLTTLELLGLGESIASTCLTGLDGDPGRTALARAYEASGHHHDGPLTTPALCDRWTGRVVSNHTDDILRDIVCLFGESAIGRDLAPWPAALAREIDSLARLPDGALSPSAVQDLLERQLRDQPYVLGDSVTLADVDVWVHLIHGEGGPLDAGNHPRLCAYARRLGAHPAFRGGQKVVVS